MTCPPGDSYRSRMQSDADAFPAASPRCPVELEAEVQVLRETTVVSGLWGYAKDRGLAQVGGRLERDLEAFRSQLQGEQEALKSRLQREQEAFLIHSPRVTRAVRL